jgi:lysozyme
MKIGNSKNKWLVGVVAAVTISTVSLLEGHSNDPYQDIVGVWTVCDGETNVKMRRYTDAECDGMLRQSLVKYGNGILECIAVPISQNQHAAFTSFAYNVGIPSFCKSSLVKKLNAGDYVGACNGMLAWTYAGGKFEQGLANRRKVEQRLCLKGST